MKWVRASGRLLVVAPYQDEDAFLARLGERLSVEVQTLTKPTSRATARSLFARHGANVRLAWLAFGQRHDCDFLIFGEQFLGLYYGLLCRLAFWRPARAQAMVLQLIYNRQPSLAGRVYKHVFAWLASAPSLTWLVCHSAQERRYYGEEFPSAGVDKLRFVPFGRGAAPEAASVQDLVSSGVQPYFFSGGTSNRDYASLLAAFAGLPARLLVACHPQDVAGLEVPPNVQVRHDLFGPDFQRALAEAVAVVLPISNTEVSAGQLVLIDAMRAAKACVVTSGSCMEDYVDAESAVSVPPQDVAALRAAVLQLANDPAACDRLGRQAWQRYAQRFTRAAFAGRLAELFEASREVKASSPVLDSL